MVRIRLQRPPVRIDRRRKLCPRHQTVPQAVEGLMPAWLEPQGNVKRRLRLRRLPLLQEDLRKLESRPA